MARSLGGTGSPSLLRGTSRERRSQASGTQAGDLKDSQLDLTVVIRGQPLTVCEALLRSLAHASFHVGQIVFLAKPIRGVSWQPESDPGEGPEESQAEEVTRYVKRRRPSRPFDMLCKLVHATGSAAFRTCSTHSPAQQSAWLSSTSGTPIRGDLRDRHLRVHWLRKAAC
jgi:hypothetical protein